MIEACMDSYKRERERGEDIVKACRKGDIQWMVFWYVQIQSRIIHI